MGLKIGSDNAKYFFAINPYRSHYYGEGIDTVYGYNKRYDFKFWYTVVQFAGLDVGESKGPGFGFSFDLDIIRLKYKITLADSDLKYEKYYGGITVGYSLWARVNPAERISLMLTYNGMLLNSPMKNYYYYYRVSNLSLGLVILLGGWLW